MDDKVHIDIIMLSTFDENAGGRETWLYNFLPEFLKDRRIARVNLVGFRTSEDPDHKEKLLALDPRSKNERVLYPTILKEKKTRFPLAFAMLRALRKHKDTNHSVDCVFATGIFEMFIVNRIPRYKKIKKIVWIRGLFSHEKAHVIPKIARKIILSYEINQLRKFDILISNGDDISNFYKRFGLHINVIRNGVDIERWDIPQISLIRPLRVAYIGRLTQVKGIEDFFKLAESVKAGDHKDEFEFHIAGENGVYASKVKELVNQDIVVNHNVIPNKELPEFLKTIDICVALTYASAEGGGGGTSNAMLEQMAAGRIMLAWDNSIFRQYLNEKNAFLAKQFSVSELEEQLRAVLFDKDKALRKAKEGKRTVQPYTNEANVNKFKELVMT